MNWPLKGIAGDVRRWWQTFVILDHPFIFFCTLSVILGITVAALVYVTEENSPRAAEGLAYCQKECDTATLRLDSMELRFVGTGRGYICHCSVRPESMAGVATQRDGGTP